MVQIVSEVMDDKMVVMVVVAVVDLVDLIVVQYQLLHKLLEKVKMQQHTPDLVVVELVETTIQHLHLVDMEVPVLMVL
tara:strand:+ start:366 stop:599 length:234 start_codon:yes stop_codon:yes gene_type:complete